MAVDQKPKREYPDELEEFVAALATLLVETDETKPEIPPEQQKPTEGGA